MATQTVYVQRQGYAEGRYAYWPARQVEQSHWFFENWVMDNFDINCLLMELHKAMDQHNLIGDLYKVIVFVKSAYSRATKHRLDLQALSEEV